VSMIPGVTYFPAPSITVAPAGIATVGPTATIFPSAIEIMPFVIVGPAAVMRFTFRMTSGADENRVYVLGNGSSFGLETAPRPVAGTLSFATGAGCCGFLEGAHAASIAKVSRAKELFIGLIFPPGFTAGTERGISYPHGRTLRGRQV
jgi:hypothetical protein